jgi:hypothetical protein
MAVQPRTTFYLRLRQAVRRMSSTVNQMAAMDNEISCDLSQQGTNHDLKRMGRLPHGG